MGRIGNWWKMPYTFAMRRRSDLMVYALTAVLLLGAASIWWQGVRPSPICISPTPTNPEDHTETNLDQEKPVPIWVHVAGAVENPGVYCVEEGSRLYEAIELAKPAADAHLDALNLASVLRDSDKIYVPTKEESASVTAPPVGAATQPSGPRYPVNINTASSVELQWLPGIGPALADAIITYRTENGRFENPQDITNVSGIGDKTLAKFSHLIVTR